MSAVMIPALVGVFWRDHRAGSSAPWLFALCVFFAIRGAWELVDLATIRSLKPSFPRISLGAAIIVAAAWLPHWPSFETSKLVFSLGSPGCVAVAATLWGLVILAAAAWNFETPGSSLENVGIELLGVFYCGVLTAMTAQLRWMAGGDWGYLALGSVVVATKCGDIGAYTLGRLLGRKKMAPKLSPGKTWAGFYGALLGACGGIWAWLHWATPAMAAEGVAVNLPSALLLGVVLGGVGLVGDLCESLIKRDAGKKDAASIVPGFGGLLDLLDSVLFAGPIGWLWWMAWPPILASGMNSP
jgi:phosphatidate cytidylyltransferase